VKSVEELRNIVKDRLLLSVTSDRTLSEGEYMSLIDDLIKDECKDAIDRATAVKKIYQSIRQNDVIQDLIDDDEITEIMINGYKSIFIEKQGKLSKTNIQFESEERLRDVTSKMVSKVNRVVNESNPIVDARLDDGSRINVVLPPISLDGPIVTIRKFSKKPLTMEKLIEMGSITKEAAHFLEMLVKARYNIFISGGTGSGKTTFLNALSDYIPKDERIITIEDVAELQLHDIPNLVRLEVRNANIEGENEVTIRDLIKTALRARPDVIIVGEIRDGAAVDLLDAYNTGHDGSLSTGHANSAYDMISRLESMVLMGANMPISVIRSKIASAIDIIIHLSRLPDKSRCVYEISEVTRNLEGDVALNKIYEYDGGLVRTKNKFLGTDKLRKAGIMS
jgi:pilus assembly protein CpaF